jgi:hypothetical protein
MAGSGDRTAANRKETEGKADAALRASPYFPLRAIRCRCDGDVIVLEGRVSSYHHKQLAQETVAHLDGMPTIVNEIGVEGS